jgi:chlorite dismutase
MPNGGPQFSPVGNHSGVNLGFTKFLFIVPRRDDDAAGTRLRAVGSVIARGFFNDFDADGTRDTQPHETIQFLIREGEHLEETSISAARYAVQVCSKYRPRLQEIEAELRRRLTDAGEVLAIDGAERTPRYTSPDMYEYAYRRAVARKSGRIARNAFVLPMNKTAEWWCKPTLERHAYFYPHVDAGTGCAVNGHARTAEPGIATVFRRLYHNPDGYSRPGEYDFVTYFECQDDHVDTFDRVCHNLRDVTQNPEWRYVMEGPLWRGRRVLKW